ncbi:MAG: endonuclease [Pseudonocardia sp.]|uniref:endonuclease n=1 Tax=unclassified Pseudonocardia TaxID=2619320 RepID=UPI00086D8B41|nr:MULTISPECIES: endonuclease [unclassified Pseudonocardia]MBN9107382.1 endonuclease [Pseudonocardia sp.]ODU26651.1 MAG: endonuclease [Pseudonocardia sp. SCN 72-51]ODV06618.1 MAG: endonuclease [Pseudonocardia sp. SCN 73-27]
MTRDSTTVDTLLDAAGRTYADQAGITLRDKPAPLYRLLVLAVLLSTRIRADIAVDAARELVRSGMGTPTRMREASWQDRVDALGRAHYSRYDESTATALGEGAELMLGRWRGDLRRLRAEADGSPTVIRDLLTEMPRLGPTGADIFCREAQDVWPELRPALDGKARQGAQRLNLPTDPHRLARLVADNDLGRLAAALTRAALDADVRRAVLRDR